MWRWVLRVFASASQADISAPQSIKNFTFSLFSYINRHRVDLGPSVATLTFSLAGFPTYSHCALAIFHTMIRNFELGHRIYGARNIECALGFVF